MSRKCSILCWSSSSSHSGSKQQWLETRHVSSLTFVTSTCSTSPAFFSTIIFSYLLTTYDTQRPFIPPFLRLFQPSSISSVIDLEHCCLHQPYPPVVVVDHQQPAPFYPTQRRDFIISLRYHFVTTTSLISSTLDHTTVDERLQITTSAHTRLSHSITINTSQIITSIKTNYSVDGSVNHHPNSFGQSSTTEIIDEHSPLEVANSKSDAHLVYPRKMTFTTQPLVPHLKRMILIIHTNSSMIPCPPTLNSLPLFFIDAISVQEDQLHTSVHLIWRAYVRIRYLFSPIFGYYHHHICLLASFSL